MDLRRLRLSLLALQLVGVATLLRSVAYDRWITVLASVLLLVGASAALRGRAWGVALALGAAVAFPVAWAIGIAPAWFCAVGVVGALPFLIASRAFARFDKGATAILALSAASAGAAGALAWKQFAWSIFTSFPSWAPSMEAQHGLALMTLVASAVVATRVGRRGLGEETQVRVGHHVRIADASERDVGATAELEESNDDVYEPRRASRRT